MVNCINLIIEMSPRFVLGRENVPCVAEVVDRSLKADCTDFTFQLCQNLVNGLYKMSHLAEDVHRRRKLTTDFFKLSELTILVLTISISGKKTYHVIRG